MSDYKENLAHPTDSNPLWKVMEGNYDNHFIKNEEEIPKQIHQIWIGSPLLEK